MLLTNLVRHFLKPLTRTSAGLALACLCLGIIGPVAGQMLPEEQSSFDLAQRLFRDESYANAAQEYRRFIVNFPTSDRLPMARLRLGEAYFRGRNYAEATTALQGFLDNHPGHLEAAGAMRLMAEALQQMGEYRKAGAAYQDVHDAYMGGEYAHQDLLLAGTNLHRAGDLEQAETAFRSLMVRYPSSALRHEAAYQLGRVLLAAGRQAEALDRFQSLVEETQSTERKPDALLETGKLALARHDIDEAARVFGLLRTEFSGSRSAEESYLEMASWYASRGDWEQAAATYQSARQALPKGEVRQQAVLGLARAKRKVGDSAAAQSLYEQFLKVYPQSPLLPGAWLGLGRTYANQANHRDALQAFDRLAESFPEDSVSVAALRDVGDSWRAVGMPRKALSAYQSCARRTMDPTLKASLDLRIATVYEADLGWHDRATQAYSALIGGQQRDYAAQAQFGLARTFDRTGQTDLALREYQAYLRAYPGGPQASDAEIRIRYLREFGADAESGTGEVSELLGKLPEVLISSESQYLIGEYQFSRRNYEAAAASFERSIGCEEPARADRARYLLGESRLKLALKARLTDNPEAALAFRTSGAADLEAVVSDHPDSPWADDAAVALIEMRVSEANADTAHARGILVDYASFQKQYPHSDRLDLAVLRTADAHRTIAAVDTGYVRTAESGYREFIRRFPDSALADRAAFGLGACQALAGDYVASEETLRSFLFDFPGSSLIDDVRFELGRILMAREYYRSAAEEFSELLAAPSSLRLERTARARLAECYFRAGDFSRAIDEDIVLLRRGPDGPALRRLARAYQGNGRPDFAVDVYASFLQYFPDAADADSIAYSRADLLSHMKRTAEAVSAFQGLAQRFPDSALAPDAEARAADLLFDRSDFGRALAGYRRIPSGGRTDAVAGREVLCLFSLDRVEEARKAAKAFRKAHKKSGLWLSRFNVAEGKHAMRSGNYKRAKSRFEDVLAASSEESIQSEAEYYLTRVLGKEGKREDHLKALLAFVKQRPDSEHWAEAALELAELYEADADYAAASKFYREAIERGVPDEDRPGVLARLVTVHRNLRLFDTAIAYARRLVEEFPRDSRATRARVDIGLIQFDNRDYQAAVQELSPQLKTAKGDDWSMIQYHIAESYRLMNDLDSAQREFLRLRYENKGIADWLANALEGLAKCYIAQNRYPEAIKELEDIVRRFGPSSAFGFQAGETARRLRDLQAGTPRGRPDQR
jgi:TolA-binding protein